MKTGIVFQTLFLTFLMFSAVLKSVSAQQKIVGVGIGDWFRYGVHVSWSSNDSLSTPSSDSRSWNETEYVLNEVIAVVNTTIHYETVQHFKNGTENTFFGNIDVNVGAPAMELPNFISALLSENDTIYPTALARINETVVRDYPSGPRLTNRLNLTIPFFGLTISVEYDWDRTTGAVVEFLYKACNNTQEYVTIETISMVITDSNMWIIPEFPSFLILPLFMMATLLAVIVYRRKHTLDNSAVHLSEMSNPSM